MHSHSSPPDPRPLSVRLDPRTTRWTPARAILAAVLILGAIVTAAALVWQWPSGQAVAPTEEFHTASPLGVDTHQGRVAEKLNASCTSGTAGRVFERLPAGLEKPAGAAGSCPMAAVDITSGPDQGRRTVISDTFASGAQGAARLETGDKVRLAVSTTADGERTYSFQDFQRKIPVVAWILAAVAGIAVVGAWRGVRAIIGLVVTLAVIGGFLLPALAAGKDPVLAAITACAAVLYLVLVLVHGANWKTASALGGTLLAMLIGLWIAGLTIDSNNLRGLADENNLQVLLYLPGVQITGLLMAGFILGTLGVLNDVTVAQAATIGELAAVDPSASRFALFARALRVGRDHLASTVYTLVLSYAGAALPLLVLLNVSGRSFLEMLTSDVMATEVMRSVTGSLALVVAVPLTTLIAALTLERKQPEEG